jgi:hypothetical protein
VASFAALEVEEVENGRSKREVEVSGADLAVLVWVKSASALALLALDV